MSDVKTLIKPENLVLISQKLPLRVKVLLNGTLASIWLGLAIGSRTDLRSVRITYKVP